MSGNEGVEWVRRQLEFEAFMRALREPAPASAGPPEQPAEPVTEAADRHPRVAA